MKLNPSWKLYLIENRLGQLYAGITTDVSRRFEEHQANGAKTARSLKGKGPLQLRFSAAVGSHSDALKLEYKVKRLPRQKKLALIDGELAIDDV